LTNAVEVCGKIVEIDLSPRWTPRKVGFLVFGRGHAG